MRIAWTRPALRDLPAIWAYVAQDKPDAAARLVACLKEAADLLSEQPHIGRAGRIAETRELVVSGTPYILVYRVRAGRVQILAALHGMRRP